MIKRDCFIIAPIGTTLAPLTALVVEAGWRILNFESIESGASPFFGSAVGPIGAADAVIVVLDKPLSPNIMFEAGLALGRGCPLLLVSVSDASFAPFERDPILVMLPRVRAKLTDNSALRFHVTAFLEGIEKGTVTRPSLEDRSLPLPKSSKLRLSAPASLLERQLFEAFQIAAEVSAVHHEPRLIDTSDYFPDFAVWLSDDRAVIINPMLVEVTGLPHDGSLRKLEQLQRYAVESGIGTIMLVEGEDDPLMMLELSPMTFKTGLKNLESLLARGELLGEMSNARNKLVHGFR